MKKLLPYITGLSASMIFGFSFLFTKTAIDFVTPFHFLAYRFSFAFAFLSFLKAVGLLKTKISVKSLKDLGFLAFVQPLLYFSLEITGINLTTSIEAGIIISTIPVFVLILSRIFLKEFLNTLQLFSMFLSMAGVLLITLSRGLSFSRNLAGVLFLVACSFSAAIYNILSRKASTKYTAADITYHMMLFGFVGFGTISFLGSLINGEVSLFLQGLAIKEVLISALYLGVLSSAVTFFLLNYTLSKIPATRASVFPYVSTAVALFAGFVFRNERLTSPGIIGAVMIFLGVWWINAFASKQKLEGLK
ncbi:MAG: EamA family transporter [Kosmotoga sp.]|uniref:DMT family transporter n=1 Tax=Kosmotoga sp. TaxID=1955248 RepID=UPI001DA8E6AB|nr:EamA family transporter [Kosmotoga sp.]MBO8166987.1 EamA family transporter [Kosmotoga sp.]